MKQRHLSLLTLLLLSVGTILILEHFRLTDFSPPTLADLDELPLNQYNRVLILAPHNDDEVLGAGGFIAQAARLGLDIKVVLATNGDAYALAAMDDIRRIAPRPKDYVRMGVLRQQESLNALQILGVPVENVQFLGYPDRGLAALWTSYWATAYPYHSSYTDASASPYEISYNPEAVYAGEDFLADLQQIIKTYQPDLIITSHPQEVHGDHANRAQALVTAMRTGLISSATPPT
jgi:LmbE family N-acetylglucosaminyl deacetylase